MPFIFFLLWHIIIEVKKMKFEWKVGILGILFSLVCMLLFTYGSLLSQKTFYAYQVGIYKEESNKDEKLAELKNQGFEGYCYQKDNQYYVLSMISEDQKAIEKHAAEVKGIMKSYVVGADVTIDELLTDLAKGVTHD